MREITATRRAAGPQRSAELREARAQYQHSIQILTALQQAGTLPPAWQKDLTDTQAFLAACEQELAGTS